MKSRHLFASTAAFGLAIALAQPAFAQDQTAAADQAAETEEAPADAIVVTGSRIRSANIESTVPITTVGGEEFFQTGSTSIGDVLNELPQLRNTFSQSNAGRFLGTVGLNLLDLRGLGTQRTLVVVNGRRHVGSDILANAVSVDVNQIPSDLIERVEIVTGGSSAVYGSDAIAGVVNFVLKDDFEGIQVRGQGGISTYEDAGSYIAAAMIGTNFDDDRGNVVLAGEYAHQNLLYGSSRSNVRTNSAFVQVDSDPSGSDGNPDRIFFKDIRGATISSAGLFSIVQRGPVQGVANPTCGLGPNAGSAQQAYNCNFLVTNDGLTLTPQTGTRVGFGPNGVFIGGNGFSNREENLITLYPNYDRYNINLLAHYSISDALEPFIEAKYVKTQSFGRSSGPAFVQGSSIDANRERIRLDNPFLTSQMRTTLTQQILASGVNPNLATPTALTAANITAINNGSFRVSYRKNFTDLGVRDEESDRQTYRIVGGLRGDFNDDWHYEASLNYGEFKEDTKVKGNINIQRFLLAMDAGVDPATGQVTCRAKFDPAARIDFVGAGADSLAADIAACVPLNPFGRGDVSASRAYIVQDTISHAKLQQFVANAYLTGDSSEWFELPGGAMNFALGAEYRKEKVFYQADPLVENGFTFYNALPTFDPDAFEVKEAFGEIRLPILSDTTFFEELTVTAAGRIADYNGATGTVYSYNAGVDWSPVKDVRFRANYSRAVRAPNLSETSFPLSQNFAPNFQDPCRPANIGAGTATRAANCATALGGLLATFDLPAYSLETVSGSNADLNEEKSDSWTFGAVFTPSFVPGLSLSVDYFNIKVDDVITAPTAQQIVNACYDAPDLNNQFCQLFERNLTNSQGPNDEDPGQILDGTLDQIPLNYAALKVRGIDVEGAYNRDIEGLGKLGLRLVYTHMIQNDEFLNPADPTFANQLNKELGDPQDAFNFDVNLETGPFKLGYQMRYISKMVLNQYEDFFSKQGRAPQDADYADRTYYPSVLYHDARVGIEANEKFEFYFGVDNITNRKPPLGLTGITEGGGIYDVRGRFFYAGAKATF
ncbi:TonB-dependent receptor domain-containing protein [Sphingomonas sp. LaA6.9]|uniref:TonB-dependent receptor domain-containing protein n=1 Tax=Sphingomonas sp. LaA6.9 TaxID=2919914 RepID=UPI001F4F4A9F|nr:TonB-dependent receptor [Sphingomonas sp. LaA6.9]MCJ8156792.1 TonB-dependent receptor [Sphingomonas sp. LaA6.9]